MKKKNSDAAWWALAGVLIAAVLLMIAISDTQDQAQYKQARGLLDAGDCGEAVQAYSALLRAPRLLDMRGFAYRAGREKDQCEMYLRAFDQENQGRPGDAAATLYHLMDQYRDTPLMESSKENLTEIVNAYDVDSLASKDFCSSFEGIAGGTAEDFSTSTQTFPKIVDACGRMYEAEGDYASAITWYNDFLEGHLQHDWTNYFRDALARAMLAHVKQTGGASSLPDPVWIGQGTGSTFVLTVYNESPAEARVVVTGVATQIMRVPGCKNCSPAPIPATGSNPQSCEHKGRSTRFELPVGSYQVLIESGSGETKRIYEASWWMSTGQYEICFTSAQDQ